MSGLSSSRPDYFCVAPSRNSQLSRCSQSSRTLFKALLEPREVSFKGAGAPAPHTIQPRAIRAYRLGVGKHRKSRIRGSKLHSLKMSSFGRRTGTRSVSCCPKDNFIQRVKFTSSRPVPNRHGLKPEPRTNHRRGDGRPRVLSVLFPYRRDTGLIKASLASKSGVKSIVVVLCSA